MDVFVFREAPQILYLPASIRATSLLWELAILEANTTLTPYGYKGSNFLLILLIQTRTPFNWLLGAYREITSGDRWHLDMHAVSTYDEQIGAKTLFPLSFVIGWGLEYDDQC